MPCCWLIYPIRHSTRLHRTRLALMRECTRTLQADYLQSESVSYLPLAFIPVLVPHDAVVRDPASVKACSVRRVYTRISSIRFGNGIRPPLPARGSFGTLSALPETQSTATYNF